MTPWMSCRFPAEGGSDLDRVSRAAGQRLTPTPAPIGWTYLRLHHAGGRLLPIALASGESLTAHTLHGWVFLFALAWLGQVAGQSAITWSRAHLPAAFGAVTLLVNPVTAALFAWAILGERIGPLQAIGGAIVLIGIAMARQGSVVSRQAS
jgi:drug/metabolite transporter (DMT)-like permease